MQVRFFAGFLFLILSITGCAKQANVIPNIPVNVSIPLTDPNLVGLKTDPGVAVLNANDYGGVAGIIIVRYSGKYLAFDRSSTVNPEKKCAVSPESPGSFVGVDPCSGAKFLLLDGSPAKAPAEISLKQYNVSVFGNLLRVTN